jgi:pyruvate kinase
MALFRNVTPAQHEPKGDDIEDIIGDALQILWRIGAIVEGDRVILTMGHKLNNEGGTNTLRLLRIDQNGGVDRRTELDLGNS